MSYSELAQATGGSLRRGDGRDQVPSSLCLDSRKAAPGQLFWALRGRNFDAHEFLDAGLAATADGWVVGKGFRVGGPLPPHLLEVPDTLQALGALAARHRMRFSIPVAAITGSNGKTTTKEMLRSMLCALGPVCANSGNFNNEVGLPLAVLELEERHRSAVFEMGASRRGDIAYLCGVARPSIGILTNIGTAHLEFFGSVENTFLAKTELLDGVAADGPVVFNLDDPRLARLKGRLGTRCVTFGRHPQADVRILDAEPGRIKLALPAGALDVPLDGAGPVHRLNAAAAAAAAWKLGLGLDAMARGLRDFVPAPLRFSLRRHASGARLVVDAYNANPESMRAGIETFLEAAQGTRPLLVLGDMKELGAESPRLHGELGRWIAGLPLGGAYLAGPQMLHAARALAEAKPAFPVLHAPEPAGLVSALRPLLKEGTRAYFKGSRAMRLEELVEKL